MQVSLVRDRRKYIPRTYHYLLTNDRTSKLQAGYPGSQYKTVIFTICEVGPHILPQPVRNLLDNVTAM